MCHQCWGWSRRSWFSSQLSLSRMWPGRRQIEIALAKHAHTNTTEWSGCVTVAVRTHQHSREEGINWGHLSKRAVEVIQKEVPDGVASAALTDGKLIWLAVWTWSSSSLAQINSAQSSLSGSHLCFQHVQVAPVCVTPTPLRWMSLEGGKCNTAMNLFLQEDTS